VKNISEAIGFSVQNSSLSVGGKYILFEAGMKKNRNFLIIADNCVFLRSK
jgi:hypothetical protein